MTSIKVKDISQLMEDGLNMNLPAEKKVVIRAIDIAHKDMAEIRDWPKLRLKKSFVMATTDTALPENLIGITGVKSATEVYFKSEEEDTLSIDGRPHWYYASQVADAPTLTNYFNIRSTTGELASATVEVFYWACPDTLTSPDDDILIPGPRALAMLSIVILQGFIDHEPGASEPFRDEYNRALAELLTRYPATVHAKAPRGRHGQPLALGDIG